MGNGRRRKERHMSTIVGPYVCQETNNKNKSQDNFSVVSTKILTHNQEVLLRMSEGSILRENNYFYS
jgi:hypothetical protein